MKNNSGKRSLKHFILKQNTEVHNDTSGFPMHRTCISLKAGDLVVSNVSKQEFNNANIISVQKVDYNEHKVTGTEVFLCPKKRLCFVDKAMLDFLIAVESPQEKVALLQQKNFCESLTKLKVGDRVEVFGNDDNPIVGSIQFIGSIKEKGHGKYLGIELLGDSVGDNDGTINNTRYFNCPKNTGVFVAINRIKPLPLSPVQSIKKIFDNMQKPPFPSRATDSKMTYEKDNSPPWMSDQKKKTDNLNIRNDLSHFEATTSKERSEKVPTELEITHINGETYIYDSSLKKDTLRKSCQGLSLHFSQDDGRYSDNGYYDIPDDENDIVVGSLVVVTKNDKPYHGVVKWMGNSKEDGRRVVGLEMDEEKFDSSFFEGQPRFKCKENRAYFANIEDCQIDSRFCDVHDCRKTEDFGAVESPVIKGLVPPISDSSGDITQIYGKVKGIQGHHNSCYLDATLFSMFTFTSVFDNLLYRPRNSQDIVHYNEVQQVLREEIVNPLRQNSYVRADRVMKLRQLMEKLSSVSGLTTEEKDPEEFLTSLVAQLLKAEPFLKLSSGQEAYHYQLFVEKKEKLSFPTVQQLFEQSFFASDIKLKEVPSCLIIQMPRFGKTFKMYPRILPSLVLDVTDVIENSPRQCIICGNLATAECRQCFDEGPSTEVEFGLQNTTYCGQCLLITHNNDTDRSEHKWRNLEIAETALTSNIRRQYMDLFAVVCIETSHYVAFVKCGVDSQAPWCFFDSMADRKGEQDGYNIPEVVPCPDLSSWLTEKGAQAFLHKDKHIPELAKRLFCDAYMCMYQSNEIMMYR